MSAKAKLSSHDRRDLEKFMKFLAIKAVQVIVQSRLGERSKTKSKPYSCGAEWFNVAIKDLPDVQTEAKKVLANGLPMFGANMCTEISLKTVDGDTLVLETWSLGMTEKTDPMVKVIPTVYNRMSLLLKSLIAVSRVTPAYKLSSCQGSDSYVICYKVYMGDSQNSQLGERYHEARIGQVGTPGGMITLNVAYRTKLAITPQQSARQSPIMLKSDHFKPDHSPKHKHRAQAMNGTVVDLHELEQLPTFKNCVVNQPQKSDNPKAIPNEHCNLEHSESAKYQNNEANSITVNGKDVPKSSEERKNDHDKHTQKTELFTNGSITNYIKLEEMKVGAFAPSKGPESAFLNFLLPDAPFQSLLNHVKDANSAFTNQKNKMFTSDKKHGDNSVNKDTALADKSSKNFRTDKSLDMNQNTVDLAHQRSVWMEDSIYDDFVLVDLKPPFAANEGSRDLGAFFRECRTAPPLASFSQQPTLEEQMSEISHQLATLETSLHDFDNFVDSVCQTDSPTS
ncbi:autophagy-related protein 13-like isoform X1 [Tachypleus tridentatus]|uniref:autophagy-related protein 13-like isoform X1 n=2 Tax=Tachypleus tridentatus TaxID=6853 RepID=UPI003FD132C0